MTPLHWLAYNNDDLAIQVLLDYETDHLIFSHDQNLPIDIAGTTPNYSCVDAFLRHFQKIHKLKETAKQNDIKNADNRFE